MRAAPISLLTFGLLAGCSYLPTIEIGQSPEPAPLPLVEARPNPTAGSPVSSVHQEPLVERPASLQTTPIAAVALTNPVKNARPKTLDAAMASATQTSQSVQFDGTTAVFDYTVGGIYQVIARFGHITVIALQPGERFQDVTGGDAVRWKIEHQTSGDREYLVLKPIRPDISTNVLVTTDRHEYLLDLRSVDSDRPFNPRVAWNYPQEFQKLQITRQQAKTRAEESETIVGADPSKLDFRYRIETVSGDPAWKPTQVFTDGRQTWIQFRPDLGAVEAPVLFTSDAEGVVQVNYRIKNNFYVVDRALAVADLVLGRDPQERVRITREPRK